MLLATSKSSWLISLLVLLIVPFGSLAASDETPHLKGKTDVETILNGFSEFMEEYQRFEPSESEIQQMSTLTGKSLLVMFGSWCHDSEREVPRLIKLLEKSQVQLDEVIWLAVDYSKQEESGLAEQYELKYTPTFVLLDGTQELGRIVERPDVSIAKDLEGFAVN